MSSPAHGPRALDVHHGAKLRPSTHARYRAAAGKLVVWLKQNQFSPNSAGEWDDLLVEWKSDSDLRKSDFEAAVAAVEFLMPHLRGKLSWTRAVLAGWASAHVARHTVPLCRGPAHLLACHLAADGHPRLAAGLVLQRELGLRPSEMLDLRCDNVTLPEQVPALRGRPRAVLALGTRASTKAKREQAVVLRDPVLLGVLRWAAAMAVGGRLFPYSYAQYRKLLARGEVSMGVEAGFTPHSPRAGFATDSIAEGAGFIETKEAGRWVCDSSLRVYLDIVGAAAIATACKLRGLESAQAYAVGHLVDYLPGARAFQRPSDHGDERLGQRRRWPLSPALEPRRWCSPAGLSDAEEDEALIDPDALDAAGDSAADRKVVSFGAAEAVGIRDGGCETAARGRGRGQARARARGRGTGATPCRA